MKNVDIFLATQKEDFSSAWSLVEGEFRKSKYITESEHLTPIHEEYPLSKTFIIKNPTGEVVATISYIPDSDHGLPLDSCFRDEFTEAVRSKNLRLAEISRLAVHPDYRSPLNAFLPALYSVVLAYGVFDRCDAFGLTVNPKHSLLYDRFGFSSIGEEKMYTFFHNVPSQAKLLFLDESVKSGKRVPFFMKSPDPSIFTEAFLSGKEPHAYSLF